MSYLTPKDLHTPFNTKTILKLIGKVGEAWHEQATAGTAAGAVLVRGGPANHTGTLRSAYVVLSAAAAAGESMTYDLKVNGTSVLTAPLAVDDSYSAGVQVELPLDATKLAVTMGDVITTDRTYVAGGGPTPIGNNVVYVEWS